MLLTNQRHFSKLWLSFDGLATLCPHLCLPHNQAKLIRMAKRFSRRHTREYVVNFYLFLQDRR